MAEILIHPTAATPAKIKALQARTGMCAIITMGIAHLVSIEQWHADFAAQVEPTPTNHTWTGPGAA